MSFSCEAFSRGRSEVPAPITDDPQQELQNRKMAREHGFANVLSNPRFAKGGAAKYCGHPIAAPEKLVTLSPAPAL
jgi:hypothetical protein